VKPSDAAKYAAAEINQQLLKLGNIFVKALAAPIHAMTKDHTFNWLPIRKLRNAGTPIDDDTISAVRALNNFNAALLELDNDAWNSPVGKKKLKTSNLGEITPKAALEKLRKNHSGPVNQMTIARNSDIKLVADALKKVFIEAWKKYINQGIPKGMEKLKTLTDQPGSETDTDETTSNEEKGYTYYQVMKASSNHGNRLAVHKKETGGVDSAGNMFSSCQKQGPRLGQTIKVKNSDHHPKGKVTNAKWVKWPCPDAGNEKVWLPIKYGVFSTTVFLKPVKTKEGTSVLLTNGKHGTIQGLSDEGDYIIKLHNSEETVTVPFDQIRSMLEVGVRVRIKDTYKGGKQEIVGKKGIIEKWLPKHGMWGVRLDGRAKGLIMRPSDLEILNESGWFGGSTAPGSPSGVVLPPLPSPEALGQVPGAGSAAQQTEGLSPIVKIGLVSGITILIGIIIIGAYMLMSKSTPSHKERRSRASRGSCDSIDLEKGYKRKGYRQQSFDSFPKNDRRELEQSRKDRRDRRDQRESYERHEERQSSDHHNEQRRSQSARQSERRSRAERESYRPERQSARLSRGSARPSRVSARGIDVASRGSIHM